MGRAFQCSWVGGIAEDRELTQLVPSKAPQGMEMLWRWLQPAFERRVVAMSKYEVFP